MAKRQQSEKPLRDWFAMDHNSNVMIERRDDGTESSVATQYQKMYGASDRRGTRDDEFDGRDDARDRQRERPRQQGGQGGYEPPRVVVVRSRGAPASYGNASNPPPPMEAPPPDPPPPPPTQPMPPHRHERVANPPPPMASMGGGAAWDRGRAPNPAAAPFYPSAGARPSAAPMGRLPYAAADFTKSMASAAPMGASTAPKTAPMASLSAPSMASYASRGGAHNPPPPSSQVRSAKYVRPSRYDVYDTDRDDDSDTDPEEDRRRRESLARERDPARRPRDAPGEPLPLGASEEARRRRSLSESLSRHDSLGERSSQGKPAGSRAPPKAAGTATHAASRVSGILNAIAGPGRLSAPKPMVPVGAAAAPRVKDTSFEERARALADEKKRKAAEATAVEAAEAEAEAERAAVKRARLAKEAKEATRVVPRPEPAKSARPRALTVRLARPNDKPPTSPETIEVSDEDSPDDKPAVIVDDDDSDIDAFSDVEEDDKARVEEDEEARGEKIRAKKKLKKEKQLKKKMSDASEKAVENSVEDRQASPVEPLGGVVPDDAVGIIHNAKYPAYYLLARDVYVQRLFRSAGACRAAKETPDLCIRRFRVKASDAEPTEVKFENTDATGNSSTKSVPFLRSYLALFRWAAREWGRDSHHLKLFYDAYSGGKKQYKDVMDGKD